LTYNKLHCAQLRARAPYGTRAPGRIIRVP
jgi:hypothetical protein